MLIENDDAFKARQNSNILRHLNFSITEFRKSNVCVNDVAFPKVCLIAFLKAV